MDEQEQRILSLLAKFEKGGASDQELEELDIWYQSFNKDAKYTNTLSESEQMQAKQNLLVKINNRLSQELAGEETVFVSHKQVNFWPRFAIAAMVILCLSIGVYFIKYKTNIRQQVARYDIAPGGNKAFLTLANGQKISLTDARNGQLARQAGSKVIKTGGGVLSYTAAGAIALAAPGAALSYNTIETPKGGQYQVNLPDGTKVWLNAASSLKYPTSFTGIDRKVQLTGEAYFEVAHNRAHPFLVKTDKETITVLGTHFNVNAYNDEPVLKTTLIEGSVSVNAGLNTKVIKPGQQATLTANKLAVDEVDTEEATAWKNGIFQFSDESLESIMRKIARWYDVDIEYANTDIKSLPLTGVITHFANASKVLRMLELTKQVNFKIEGRKIIVMSAKGSAGAAK